MISFNAIFPAFADDPAWMPEWLCEESLELKYWQWLGLLLFALLGVIIDNIVRLIIRSSVFFAAKKKGAELDPGEVRKFVRPLGLVAMGLFWYLALHFLQLPPNALRIVELAVRFVCITAVVWGAYRLVDLLSAFLESRAKKTESKFDDLLIPLSRKSLKIFVVAFGLVFIADNLQVDITSLVAGLGIGGLAIALAAKDAVANLFGSFTILIDKPFQVGDWVVIGSTEGIVEEIAFRSTRIRTFYNSQVTLPNSLLLSAMVDNYGRRRYRRWKTMLGVAYETPPDRIEALCEGIREFVRIHPYTRKDYFQVYVNEYAASSINILLYIFHEVPDWSAELRERHRLMIDILRLCHRLGVTIAYPTQTIYHAPAAPSGDPPELPKREQTDANLEEGRKEARAIVEGGKEA